MTLRERWDDLRWWWHMWWQDLTCPTCWDYRLRQWCRWDVTEGLTPP